MVNFKDRLFYHCYDCGYGEKSIAEYDMSYEDVIKYFKSSGTPAGDMYADKFVKQESTCFEYGNGNDFIVADCEFCIDDWTNNDPLSI